MFLVGDGGDRAVRVPALIARPWSGGVEGVSLRAVSIAFLIAAAIGLIATPVYLDIDTAVDSLRSPFDYGALIPLFRVTAFGRAIVDIEVVFALFVRGRRGRALGRPARPRAPFDRRAAGRARRRAGGGVGAAHPRPRRSRRTDRAARAGGDPRLAAPGVGVDLARRPGRSAGAVVCAAGGQAAGRARVTVPRFSAWRWCRCWCCWRSGTWASILHLPVLNALWTTSYGQAILVKVALLAAAMVLGAINLLRTKPRLVAAQTATTTRASRRCGCCGGRSPARRCWSPAPCSRRPCCRAWRRPQRRSPSSARRSRRSGPGPVVATAHDGSYTFKLHATPNAPVAENSFSIADPQERAAAGGRRRDIDLRDARHADGKPGVPDD